MPAIAARTRPAREVGGAARGMSSPRGPRPPSEPVRAVWQDAGSIIDPQINAEGTHSWPFDPSFPIAIVHLVFDHRHPIRLNRHDYFELLYSFSGEITFQVQDRCVEIAEGDLFVMGSTLYHRPVHSGSRRAKAIAAYFLPELIRGGEETGEGVEYLFPFLVHIPSFPHVVSAESGVPKQVLGLIQQAAAELSDTSAQSRLVVKTCLKMILALLGKYYATYYGREELFKRRQQNIERLRPLFDYIDHHYMERITLTDAAAQMHMSRSHFTRFFKQVTAQSFAAYLNRFRISKGEALLASTDKSIAEISWEVGFCDQSHFGTVFRRFVHMTRFSTAEPERRLGPTASSGL